MGSWNWVRRTGSAWTAAGAEFAQGGDIQTGANTIIASSERQFYRGKTTENLSNPNKFMTFHDRIVYKSHCRVHAIASGRDYQNE